MSGPTGLPISPSLSLSLSLSVSLSLCLYFLPLFLCISHQENNPSFPYRKGQVMQVSATD